METIVSVIPHKKWLIIEAHNDYCFIRVAEPNNHIIYRLIKTDIKLILKTIPNIPQILYKKNKMLANILTKKERKKERK